MKQSSRKLVQSRASAVRWYLEDPGDGQREAGGSGHQQELGEAQAEGQQATKA